MSLAVLTGLYVGVVCSAQVGANKIVELPWHGGLDAPGGTYLIGLTLALVEVAHLTAPTRRQGWINAEVMIGCGFVASGLLAAWIAIVNEMEPAFPDQGFEVLADTWRIVLASLAAFAVSETVDNTIGSWLRGRAPDSARVIATNAISAPLDSLVFLAAAFGSLELIEGQIVAKLEATVVLGLPAVLVLRRLIRRGGRDTVSAA